MTMMEEIFVAIENHALTVFWLFVGLWIYGLCRNNK